MYVYFYNVYLHLFVALLTSSSDCYKLEEKIQIYCIYMVENDE